MTNFHSTYARGAGHRSLWPASAQGTSFFDPASVRLVEPVLARIPEKSLATKNDGPRHVITEDLRVDEFIGLAQRGDLRVMGQLCG